MRSRGQRLTRVLATLAFFTACAVAVDLWRGPRAIDDTLVFAMSVVAEDGQVLGSPVVLGTPGHRLRVNLVCEDDPDRERMSLVLDPLAERDGTLRYSYALNVPGRVQDARGVVELSPGEEKRISLSSESPRGAVTFGLYAAPVGHPGVERFLRERRLRLGRLST